jgi:multicomponent Na+:H+ antiporter subunit D
MSMLRLWQYIFWGKPNLELTQRTNLAQPGARTMMLAPAVVLVALSLAIGIFAEPAIGVVQTAASQAIDRAGYIAAVNPQPAPAPTPAPAVAQEMHP